MAQMIKYKGQMYQRVDSFKDEIRDEVREINGKFDEIIKKVRDASAFAAN